MSTEIVIKVTDVSKTFLLPHEKHTSLKSALIHLRRRKKGYEKQQVLNDISFEVKKGEFFGVIGRNGNGKSTLLKLLAGIYTPDKGIIGINGKLTPFIELGVGFNPELSGRENVFLNGALLGFNRTEMHAMYNDIVEFAELERFMDQKLKNYSSGMQVRLAFSIAIRAKSDILLIDEVLAVGDVNFQKKCMEVFEDLKREGRTIIFISHSMGYVRQFCDRVAVLDKGKIIYDGNTEKAIDTYNRLNLEQERTRTEIENKGQSDVERLGNGKATLTKYEILDHNGKETVELVTDKEFTARLVITANETVKNCATGVMFRKDPGTNLFGVNSFTSGYPIKEIKKGETIEVAFNERLPLNPGVYYVSFEVATMLSTGYEDIDYLVNAFKINVVGPKAYWAIVSSTPKITIKAIKGSNTKPAEIAKNSEGGYS